MICFILRRSYFGWTLRWLCVPTSANDHLSITTLLYWSQPALPSSQSAWQPGLPFASSSTILKEANHPPISPCVKLKREKLQKLKRTALGWYKTVYSSPLQYYYQFFCGFLFTMKSFTKNSSSIGKTDVHCCIEEMLCTLKVFRTPGLHGAKPSHILGINERSSVAVTTY